jgi:proteic killer suppression protein
MFVAGRKKLPAQILRSALEKMQLLHAARNLDDLRVPPGNKLKKMQGNWDGYQSIRINQQYRVLFVWQEGDAFEVIVTDPH